MLRLLVGSYEDRIEVSTLVEFHSYSLFFFFIKFIRGNLG